ncbi:hypothetical protein [Phytopseudomonas flavescens]|uniref:hypothetical protein n=1 Tax=Phytopseudomonas flavescens TaxID=29435 RepID=UPI001113AF21|nr:hypothetical protein [Pseudomonas flavescens]
MLSTKKHQLLESHMASGFQRFSNSLSTATRTVFVRKLLVLKKPWPILCDYHGKGPGKGFSAIRRKARGQKTGSRAQRPYWRAAGSYSTGYPQAHAQYLCATHGGLPSRAAALAQP